MKEGSWARRRSEDEPEPPAADMMSRLYGSNGRRAQGRRKGEIDHMTTCVLFYFIIKITRKSD